MTLIPIDEWQKVAKRSWSVRFAVLSVLLTGFDFIMPFLLPEHPTRILQVFAAFAAMASAGARLILQRNLIRGDEQPPSS
jgi:hypothetical protein